MIIWEPITRNTRLQNLLVIITYGMIVLDLIRLYLPLQKKKKKDNPRALGVDKLQHRTPAWEMLAELFSFITKWPHKDLVCVWQGGNGRPKNKKISLHENSSHWIQI